jgi:inner membrane protein
MPSPLAHITAGYAIYRIFCHKLPEVERKKAWQIPVLLIFAVILSMLPDVDSVLGLVMGDLGRYHNNGTHSLVIGLILAILFVGVIRWRFQCSFISWFVIVLLAYEMHVIMDFFTIGRGVMLFWPFSHERYSSPILVFYGLHWSDGVFSLRHLWTLLTEMVFLAFIFVIFRFVPRNRGNTLP